MSTNFRAVLVWYSYAAVYVIIFFILFSLPLEQWLFDLIRRFYSEFISERGWDNIYMLVILITSLIINGIVIYITTAISHRIPGKDKAL